MNTVHNGPSSFDESIVQALGSHMSATALAYQVIGFLQTSTLGTGTSGTIVSSGTHHKLRQIDARALHEMVEILSFIGEGR